MPRKAGPASGFTLLEMLCVLVIVGILAAVATLGLTRSVGQYHFSRDNDALAQKARIALRRVLVELSHLDAQSTTTVISGGPSADGSGASYTLATRYNGQSEIVTLGYAQTTRLLLVNGLPLCDGVSAFSLSPAPAGGTGQTLATVDVSLTVAGDNGQPTTLATTFAVKGHGD